MACPNSTLISVMTFEVLIFCEDTIFSSISLKNAQKKRPSIERGRSPEPKTKIYETFYEQCKLPGWVTMDVHRYALQKYNIFQYWNKKIVKKFLDFFQKNASCVKNVS